MFYLPEEFPCSACEPMVGCDATGREEKGQTGSCPSLANAEGSLEVAGRVELL